MTNGEQVCFTSALKSHTNNLYFPNLVVLPPLLLVVLSSTATRARLWPRQSRGDLSTIWPRSASVLCSRTAAGDASADGALGDFRRYHPVHQGQRSRRGPHRQPTVQAPLPPDDVHLSRWGCATKVSRSQLMSRQIAGRRGKNSAGNSRPNQSCRSGLGPARQHQPYLELCRNVVAGGRPFPLFTRRQGFADREPTFPEMTGLSAWNEHSRQ